MSSSTDGEAKVYQIRSGQGFLIVPRQTTTYTADKLHPWEYMWIEFDGLKVAEMLEIAGLTRNSPVYHARYREISREMVENMTYIIDHKDDSAFRMIGYLYLFFDALIRSVSDPVLKRQSKLIDYYIHESLVYIERNFQNDITIEDLADNCGLDRSYFGKIFHKATGRSPQEFLIHYRMTKATELLRMSELSIEDISHAVGYQNSQHFSRAFKRIFNISPREWRSLHKVQANR